MTPSANLRIRPFRIEIPQTELDDLRDRLTRARFTDVHGGADGECGTAVSRVS